MGLSSPAIPTLMLELLETEVWARGLEPEDLERAFLLRPSDRFFFYRSLEMMIQATESAPLLAEEQLRFLYGIDSAARGKGGIVDRGILDVSQALIFADNWSEESLALDYRVGRKPWVVMSVSTIIAGQSVLRYRKLAASFEEFASRLDLV